MRCSSALHPIIKANYLQRFLGYSTCVLWALIIFGGQLQSFFYGWIMIIGLAWPHLARFALVSRYHGKQREHVCQCIDAAVFAVICVQVPNPVVILALTAAACANSISSGGFKLLFRVMFVFASSTTIAYSLLEPTDFLTFPAVVQLLLILTVAAYFSLFAIMVNRSFRQLIALNKQIEASAIRDPLTQIYNRRYLDQQLNEEIDRSYRLRYPLSLIFADLDRFKRINDEHGHDTGDRVLQRFVEIARTGLRENIDWIARYGGEEFVILLPGCDQKQAHAIAERIRALVAEDRLQVSDVEIRYSCSFGIAGIDNCKAKPTPQQLLNQADSSLFRAKRLGRNRVEIFSPSTELVPV